MGQSGHFLGINPGINISIINGINLNIIWEIIENIVAVIIRGHGLGFHSGYC